MEDKDADTADRDQAIKILSLEYQSLRSEISAHIAGRYQFLGWMIAAAALVASVGKESSPARMRIWVVIAVLLVFMGLFVYVRLGRRIIRLGEEVAKLELDINKYADKHPMVTGSPHLRWESDNTRRRCGRNGWWRKIKDVALP